MLSTERCTRQSELRVPSGHESSRSMSKAVRFCPSLLPATCSDARLSGG
jgi:hypothetical protein